MRAARNQSKGSFETIIVPGFGLRVFVAKPRERTPYPLMSVALLAPDLAFDRPLASGLQQRRAAGGLAGQGSGEVAPIRRSARPVGPGKLEFGSADELVRMRFVIVTAKGRCGLRRSVLYTIWNGIW